MTVTIRSVKPNDGLIWWRDSFGLIKSHILYTLAMGIFFLGPEVLGQIPFWGGMIAAVFGTTLGAGSMAIFQAWDKGERAPFYRLFVAFWDLKLARRLVPLCLFLIAISLLTDSLILVEQLHSNPTYMTTHTFRLNFNLNNLDPVSLSLYLVIALLYSLDLTILQFFLPLVYFANTSLVEATRLSWTSGRLNWKAMGVNLLAGMLFVAVIALPYWLGVATFLSGLGMLVFFPTMLALPYIMYRELFTEKAQASL